MLAIQEAMLVLNGCMIVLNACILSMTDGISMMLLQGLYSMIVVPDDATR